MRPPPLVAVALAGFGLALCARLAAAEGAPAPRPAPALAPASRDAPGDVRTIVGYRIRGKTKTSDAIAEFLARTYPGERVGPSDIPRLTQAFVSSELFETVKVHLEEAPGGWIVVATVKDKHSWVVAPTVFALPNRKSFGVGFAENNFRGRNQKLLLYGQLGDREDLFFGVWLIPSIAGTPLTFRLDTYHYSRYLQEYANPPDDPRDESVARETLHQFNGAGVLVGWRAAWWLNIDLRLRGAYVRFLEAHAGGDPDTPLPLPQQDGWDVSSQGRITIDARQFRFGVNWGPFLQLHLDTSIPGLDDYDYSIALLRAWYSWLLLGEHQLELRLSGMVGRNLPFQEELNLGGAGDLRGYAVERFRGDTRGFFRAEYSVPITKWKFFAFRAIGFLDSGYIGWNFARTSGDRHYLPNQGNGNAWWRNNVGGGLRVYIRRVVLPLLGFDVAYAIEARAWEMYFELGLTDF